jgi:osmotically-inducible protein OsmY
MKMQTIPAFDTEKVHSQVTERMEKIELLRTLGNFLQTRLNPNGVIEVSGPAQSRLIKTMVVQTLKDIPGVQDVEDHIVADPDLELAVAEALERDDRTKDLPPGKIFVRSHLGVVTLFGYLPSDFSGQDIVDVVTDVHGVNGVQVKFHS